MISRMEAHFDLSGSFHFIFHCSFHKLSFPLKRYLSNCRVEVFLRPLKGFDVLSGLIVKLDSDSGSNYSCKVGLTWIRGLFGFETRTGLGPGQI